MIVEDIDRFSRLGVTDGVDLLFRLRRKGLAIAVVGDPFNGEVLKDLDDKGEEIIRELKWRVGKAIASATGQKIQCG